MDELAGVLDACTLTAPTACVGTSAQSKSAAAAAATAPQQSGAAPAAHNAAQLVIC